MGRVLSRTDEELYEHLLVDAESALTAGDLETARECLAHLTRLDDNDPEVVYLRGQLAWREHGASAAVDDLARASAACPDDPDMLHAHAMALLERGEHRDFALAREALLKTLALDEAHAARRPCADEELTRQIERMARRCLEALPDQFARHLHNVPVVIERRPHVDAVAEGFDPRALGLFEGPDQAGQAQHHTSVVPSRIVLYAHNLAATFPDPDELARQVEITIFHELGHFFGLDEDEVDALGLG